MPRRVTFSKVAPDTYTVFSDGVPMGTVRKLITGYWRTSVRGLMGKEFIMLRAVARAVAYL